VSYRPRMPDRADRLLLALSEPHSDVSFLPVELSRLLVHGDGRIFADRGDGELAPLPDLMQRWARGGAWEELSILGDARLQIAYGPLRGTGPLRLRLCSDISGRRAQLGYPDADGPLASLDAGWWSYETSVAPGSLELPQASGVLVAPALCFPQVSLPAVITSGVRLRASALAG